MGHQTVHYRAQHTGQSTFWLTLDVSAIAQEEVGVSSLSRGDYARELGCHWTLPSYLLVWPNTG